MADTNNNLGMPNLDPKPGVVSGADSVEVPVVANVAGVAGVAGVANSKMRLFILAGVVAALVVGGGLYYKFGYSVDEDVPPSIDMGGNAFQGMTQSGKEKFLKYEEDDVAAFKALIEENADILHDPVKLKSGVNYVYAYEDVAVEEMVQCIDPEADRVLFAQYDAKRDKFVTYPEGPFGVQTQKVDEDYVFEAGSGFVIIAAKAADAYCVSPVTEKSKVGINGLIGADDDGWFLVAANNNNLSEVIEPINERVLKAFALKDGGKFEKVDDYDYEFGGNKNYLVWLKVGEGDAAREVVDEESEQVEPDADEPEQVESDLLGRVDEVNDASADEPEQIEPDADVVDADEPEQVESDLLDRVDEVNDAEFPGISNLNGALASNEAGEQVLRFGWDRVEAIGDETVSYVIAVSDDGGANWTEVEVVQPEEGDLTYDVAKGEKLFIRVKVKVVYTLDGEVNESAYSDVLIKNFPVFMGGNQENSRDGDAVIPWGNVVVVDEDEAADPVPVAALTPANVGFVELNGGGLGISWSEVSFPEGYSLKVYVVAYEVCDTENVCETIVFEDNGFDDLEEGKIGYIIPDFDETKIYRARVGVITNEEFPDGAVRQAGGYFSNIAGVNTYYSELSVHEPDSGEPGAQMIPFGQLQLLQ